MFNPLGSFSPTSPIAPALLSKARAFMETLPTLPPQAHLNRIYYHWAVAPMGCEFKDYDAMADVVNDAWVLKITGSPVENAMGAPDESMHTWHRNSHAFGIAIAGMDGATASNFGPDPITLAGLDHLCAAGAAVARKYMIDLSESFGGEPALMTHAEAAVADLYFGERWDLATFVPLPSGVALSPSFAKICGDALRARTRALKMLLPP